MSDSLIQYNRDTIISVLRDLEQIVVSLDRTGSATYDSSQAEQDAVLAAFVRDWKVFRKLANMRKVLSEPFPYTLGEDDMGELEREFADVRYWSSKARTP